MLVADLLAAECVDFVFHSWLPVTGVVVKSGSSLCMLLEKVCAKNGLGNEVLEDKEII